MKEYKCKKCGKTKTALALPYQWSKIHEDAAGVHDSACVTWEYDYFLCPDCRTPDTALIDALQDLYDEQNGPPLIRHKKTWQAAMDKADDILTKYKEKKNGS